MSASYEYALDALDKRRQIGLRKNHGTEDSAVPVIVPDG